MAKFLNTSGTNYYLEELIKGAKDRLILISPYLRLNDRIKELLEDKNRLKIDVRIVYGKSELQPVEVNWLKGLSYVRTSFCKNLHAKCYLNEETCIITSLNLYEFSQVNNNEMGVLVQRSDDPDLFRDTYQEAQRIIRISDEVRNSLEPALKPEFPDPSNPNQIAGHDDEPEISDSGAKLTTSKLAVKLGIKTPELIELLIQKCYLDERIGKPYLTDLGTSIGGEYRRAYGGYFLWPEDLFASACTQAIDGTFQQLGC